MTQVQEGNTIWFFVKSLSFIWKEESFLRRCCQVLAKWGVSKYGAFFSKHFICSKGEIKTDDYRQKDFSRLHYCFLSEFLSEKCKTFMRKFSIPHSPNFGLKTYITAHSATVLYEFVQCWIDIPFEMPSVLVSTLMAPNKSGCDVRYSLSGHNADVLHCQHNGKTR